MDKTNKKVLDLAAELAVMFQLRIEKTNDKAYTLWDDYEILLGVVNFDEQICLSFSYSLEKLVLSTIVLNATKLCPELILASPFYFDYRDKTLYTNKEAKTRYEDAEFYYVLRSKAFGDP